MPSGTLENLARQLAEAIWPPEMLQRMHRVERTTTADGRVRAERLAGVIGPEAALEVDATQVYVEPNDLTSEETLAGQVAAMAVDAAGGLNAVTDTASVNLTKTGRAISADLIYAGTSGDYGSAATPARSDHLHDATYDKLSAASREFTQGSVPSTPASGKFTLYSNNDKLYLLDDNGNTWPVGGGQRPFIPAYDTWLANVAAAAIAANTAYLWSFRVTDAIPLSGLTVNIGASAGNVDAGLYTSTDDGVTLTRLVSNGGIASPGTGWQRITYASTWAVPGVDYWMAFAGSSASLTLLRGANPSATTSARHARHVTKGTSYPLPATITGWSGGVTSPYMEVD